MVSHHGHLHHTDLRTAFRLVRSRQARATVAAAVTATAVLLFVSGQSDWKLPALVALMVGFGLFSNRNWRCPQCRSSLPYGRVPPTLTCPRCDAVLAWPSQHL